MKNKTDKCKSLQTTCTFLCYSMAKSTLQVLLTFVKFVKGKLENFTIAIFFLLLSSSHTCITQKLYGVCEYYTLYIHVSNDYYVTEDLIFGWHSVQAVTGKLRLQKLSPNTQNVLIRTHLWLLFMYSGHGTHSQATPRLLNRCTTGCNEFASS